MRAKIKLNGPKVRLLIAGCLCVFLFMATTTTPTDGNGCSESDKGDLLITNDSDCLIVFQYSGKSVISGTSDERRPREIKPKSSDVITDIKTGSYKYVIQAINVYPFGLKEIKQGEFSIFALHSSEVIYR